MGYTGTYITGSAEDYLRKQMEHGPWTVVANKGAKYWVLRNANTGENLGVVVLCTNRNGYLTYKSIDETSGPSDTGFPLNLLNLLTPTDSDWANEWREKVRQHHANKKSSPTLKAGDTVRFATPVSFQSGTEMTELVYDGGFRFHADRPWGRENYRLNRSWRTTRDWEVVR
jgi:hypothetical protein